MSAVRGDLYPAAVSHVRAGAQQRGGHVATLATGADGRAVCGYVCHSGEYALPFLSTVGYALMAAFFPSGWNFLGRYFVPSGGYIFPMARWINLILHAALASLFGVVLGPVYLYKAWKELNVVKETAYLTQVRETDVF